MNTMVLTGKQSAVLAFLHEWKAAHGSTPTIREIQNRFGFSSPFAATRHLLALEKKGYIERSGGRARSLVLSGDPAPARWQNIPLLGSIPAGAPVDIEQPAERTIAFDADTLRLSRTARTFALEVRGESMTGAGILDGDIAIMELAEPRHRDIVAALIDGETTLKRLLIGKDGGFLRAENPAFPDLTPARELSIQGVFRALIRIHGNRS